MISFLTAFDTSFFRSDRADMLRGDPHLLSIDRSVFSIGRALGASDSHRENDDGGDVSASVSSVIANYFLKSHGGAHAFQSFCSFMATASAIGSIVLRNVYPSLAFGMLQRTFFFAMLKHISGMIAAASIAAKAIPKIGLSQARTWMKQLAVDPVSQYVFFNALLLLWLPPKRRILDNVCWWWKRTVYTKESRWMHWIQPVLVGPILIRECIGIGLVLTDIFVLWGLTEENTSISSAIETFLKSFQAVVNAVMSLFTSPDKWRTATSAERQEILSKLVGHLSLGLEVAIGVLIALDTTFMLLGAAFFSGKRRPSFPESLSRMICMRLYLHFLWTKHSSILELGKYLRSEASKLPVWVLDVIMEPAKALGIESPTKANPDAMTWKDYISIGLGLEGMSKSG